MKKLNTLDCVCYKHGQILGRINARHIFKSILLQKMFILLLLLILKKLFSPEDFIPTM